MRFDADINARTLGGTPLSSGGVTADGVWRSAAPDTLSADGWDDLTRAGIRRIVDLRNAGERDEAAHRPSGVEVVHAPLEDPDDPDYTALWDRNWATPEFYAWGIEHWPGLWRTALTAVADAPDGTVLIHCAGGRDRTGMLSAILLDAAGAERTAVLADYETGMRGTNEMLRRRGEPDHWAAIPPDRIDDVIARYRTALDALLDRVPALFQTAGLTGVLTRAARRLLTQ